MVMDDNVEIVGFFNDLTLLLRDAENSNPGTDLLILKVNASSLFAHCTSFGRIETWTYPILMKLFKMLT